jgi:hypothetical protein
MEPVVPEDQITSMKHFLLNAAILLLALQLQAQKAGQAKTPVVNSYAQVDGRAAQLPESLTTTVDGIAGWMISNFPDDADRSRAIFAWITSHIQYDIDNMFAINFYADSTEKIDKTLKTRKGICEHYATLYTSLCNRTGILSVVVVGYTKQKDAVDYIPHAWSEVRVKGEWRIVDPTWGSGIIQGGKFVRKLNNDYFNANPAAIIRSHMPFDYLWQLLHYPVTNQEFYEGKTAPDKSKPYFSYPDSIAAQLALPGIDQERAEAVRVERNGVRNSLVFDRLQHLKVDLENDRRKQDVDRQNAAIEKQNGAIKEYNTALEEYNDAIKQFNSFISYRNDQFKPAKPDPEIQQMIDSADRLASGGRTRAAAITSIDEHFVSTVKKLIAAIDELNPRIAEQEAWLRKYLGKNKLGRKMMFYK